MPTITFQPLGVRVDVRGDETILDVARRSGATIGNACGGVGVCARCRVRVLSGHEELTPPTSIEARVSADRGLAADERLACQALIRGECSVTTSYW